MVLYLADFLYCSLSEVRGTPELLAAVFKAAVKLGNSWAPGRLLGKDIVVKKGGKNRNLKSIP